MKKSHARQWICAATGISVAIAAGLCPKSVCANGVSATSGVTVVTGDDNNYFEEFPTGDEAVVADASTSEAISDSVKMIDSRIAYTSLDGDGNVAETVRMNRAGSLVVSYSTGDNTNLPSIIKEDVPAWATSDGVLYDSEAEARAHADAATPKLSSEQRSDTVWATSDGQEFATEAEARAHARSTVPTVGKGSKQVDVWLTSDGHEFANQSEADAHAESCAMAVSAKTRTVHHEAVTHEEEIITYSSCNGSPYAKVFNTREEAELYWEQTAREHPEIADTLSAVYSIYNYKTVIDVPAYDEQIPYWQTSDGATFDTEAEARTHARSTVPTVSPSTKTVPVWTTSDGKSFDAEQDARAYAESCALTVTSREDPYTVWLTSDGHEFATEAEALAFCEANKVTVSASTKQVWRTTDGKIFLSEGEALHYVDSLRTLAMYRLYNPFSGEHFYTSDRDELDSLGAAGWSFEGEGWLAPGYSDVPVYRLYNPFVPGGDHHYTTSEQERDALIDAGWRCEGTGWYSDPSGEVPVYRQYNPHAVSGSHNYTSSKDENDALVAVGWRGEGVAWYGR